MFYFLIHHLIISGYRSDEGRRIKWEGDFKRTREKQGAKNQLWRCGGGGGGGGGGMALVKGNQPGKLEPNQRPFFTSKTEQDLEVGQR